MYPMPQDDHLDDTANREESVYIFAKREAANDGVGGLAGPAILHILTSCDLKLLNQKLLYVGICERANMQVSLMTTRAYTEGYSLHPGSSS